MQLVAAGRTALVSLVVFAAPALADNAPASADNASPSFRAGLRLGADYTTTVHIGDADTLLLAGLDLDAVFEHLVLGGELSAEGGPFSHGVVFGGLHGGAQVLTGRTHAMATIAIGAESLSNICYDCDSATLTYTELRAMIAFAWTHVEFGVWVAGRADLGGPTITGAGGEIQLGGYSLGGGVAIAYLSR